MAKHGGEFRFTVEFGQQAAIEGHFAARQCPGIGHRAIEHHKLIGQFAVRDGSQLLAHLTDIGGQLRVDLEIAAFALTHGRVIFGADAQFGRFGNELNFPLARDRVSAATHQQSGQQ